MTQFGLNYDPGHFADQSTQIQEIAKTGAAWLRIVLKPDRDLTQVMDITHRFGVKSLCVFALESIGPDLTIPDQVAHYRDMYGDLLDAFQLGNEPDQDRSAAASSWVMDQNELNRYLEAVRPLLPNTPLIGPGLSSGNPDWLHGVRVDLLDAVAFHPYGKWPTAEEVKAKSGGPWGFGPLEPLAEGYAAFGKPLWVDEYGAPEFELRDPTGYMGSMTRALAQVAEVVIAFTYHGVNGFDFVDASGRKLPYYAAFTQAVSESPQSAVVIKESTVPTYKLDADTSKAIADHGWTAASDYFKMGGGGYVLCDQGIAYYLNGPAAFRFVPFE